MQRTAIILFCLILFGICGCAHTELTRRYSARDFGEAPKNYVNVSAFVMDIPGVSAKPLVSQLSPEGQRGFFEAVGAKAKNLEDIYQAADYTGKGLGPEEKTVDRTVISKRLVFSVERASPGKGADDLTPADRISELTVALDLKVNDNDPIFPQMDKLETKYGSVNLGELTRTQKTTAALEMTIGTPAQAPVSVSAKPSTSTEESFEEKINLQRRYIQISGAIKKGKKEALLFQESPVGYDLTGNFAVDLVVKLQNYRRTGIIILGDLEKEPEKKTSKGKAPEPLKPGEVKIDFGNLIFPASSAKPVEFTLASNYTIRHVTSRDREIAEGFHRVKFISGKSPEDTVELISRKELRTIIFDIVLGDETLYLGKPVASKGEKGEKVDINPLRFMIFGNARRFLSWIKQTKSTTIGNYTIYHGDKELDKKDIINLHIKPKDLTEKS